jgi:spore maturation protein CgeB
MLHERNHEVAEYFSEGTEAEFFGSDAELAEKVERYLADESSRGRIAAGGRARSIESDYSSDARMKHVVSWIETRGGRRQ